MKTLLSTKTIKQNTFKKKVLISIFLTGLSFSTYANESQSIQTTLKKPVNIGLISGGSLGAMVGGPLGAMIGATIGGLIGNAEEKQSDIAMLRIQNTEAESELTQLSHENNKLNQELKKQSHQQQIELRQVAQQIDILEAPFRNGKNLQFQIQFKTGSSTLNADYRQQLVGISRLLQAIPDLKVELNGYADQRGGAKYNQQLSQQRSASVAHLLANLGVSKQRIIIHAFGENSQEMNDLENNFFQRRVTVTLTKQVQQLAQND